MDNNWTSLGINQQMADKLIEQQMTEPTPVQVEAIPAMLQNRDVYTRSGTGTGKTLAFLLPLLQRINPNSGDVQALILAPTQELAMQIVRVAESYSEVTGIRVQQLIGGAAVKRQVERLKLKPQLVVGTPGRIHELIKIKKLRTHAIISVVVDEADQMFELGSTKELEAVMRSMPSTRQTAFFSATLPAAMAQVAEQSMRDPVTIDTAQEQRVADTIQHYYIQSEQRNKFDTTRRLLHAIKPSSALLFLSDTDQIANWESKLSYEGFKVGALYGDANKLKRSQTLDQFRDGRITLLLATEVAARGIDIQGLPLVINLDTPDDADRYVHRAGRTGRMGRSGTVVTIAAPRELYMLDILRRKLNIELSERLLYGGKLVEVDQVTAGSTLGSSAEARAQREVTSGGSRNSATERQAVIPPKTATKSDKSKAASNVKVDKPTSVQVKGQLSKTAKKAERERNRKNKGAPKWLKAKREGNSDNTPNK